MKPNILQAAITKSAQLIAVFMLSTSVSMAAVVYTYIGNNYNNFQPVESSSFYDSSMQIELSFTVDSLLTDFAGSAVALVTSYSFYDGINLLTKADGDGTFDLNTDSSGNILQWFVAVGTNRLTHENVGDRSGFLLITANVDGVSVIDQAEFYECVNNSFGYCIDTNFDARVSGNYGTWSVSSVPIPAAVWLFSSGLLGLVGMARRKKSA